METVSAGEPLTRDTPCIHCGYNLRGLTAGGVCPECGRAIDESLRGDLLRFANPVWLRKVRLGVRLQLWSIGLMAVLVIAWAGLAATHIVSPQSGQYLTWPVSLLMAWGCFALATREPRDALQLDGVSAGSLLRIVACMCLGFQLLHLAGDVLPSMLEHSTLVLGGLLWILQFALFIVILRRLAVRVPDEMLHRSSTLLLYVGSVFLVLHAAFSSYLRFILVSWRNSAKFSPTPAPWPSIMNLTIVSGVLQLLVAIFFVGLLLKYRKVLAVQVRLAEEAAGALR